MTTYNTGNPIGSIDPRDLLDNAQNLDEALLTDQPTFTDRLGRTRVSWEGAISYSVLSETYAAGIEVTTRNQVILAGGEYWKVAGSTPLPYTTTGAGMPEGGAFVSVGDAALRQDLAAPGGAGMVAGGVVMHVDTIADLLAIDTSQIQDGQQVSVAEYHAGTGAGGGTFSWNQSRPRDAHNGGSDIDPTVSFPSDFSVQMDADAWYSASNQGAGCWVRTQSDLNSYHWGAIKGAESSAALQAQINYVRTNGYGSVDFGENSFFLINRPLRGMYGCHYKGRSVIKAQAPFADVSFDVAGGGITNVSSMFYFVDTAPTSSTTAGTIGSTSGSRRMHIKIDETIEINCDNIAGYGIFLDNYQYYDISCFIRYPTKWGIRFYIYGWTGKVNAKIWGPAEGGLWIGGGSNGIDLDGLVVWGESKIPTVAGVLIDGDNNGISLSGATIEKVNDGILLRNGFGPVDISGVDFEQIERHLLNADGTAQPSRVNGPVTISGCFLETNSLSDAIVRAVNADVTLKECRIRNASKIFDHTSSGVMTLDGCALESSVASIGNGNIIRRHGDGRSWVEDYNGKAGTTIDPVRQIRNFSYPYGDQVTSGLEFTHFVTSGSTQSMSSKSEWYAAIFSGGSELSRVGLTLDAVGGANNMRITPLADNNTDLGSSSLRLRNIYAGTGTINTSDEREKQQIRELSEAESRVAVKLKCLVRAFKFSDAVEKKGEGARIHFGVIAQDVKAAFEVEGLVAENYAILCYDEWEEQQEIVDEDGNITQEHRHAGNRYGVRYEELLAFIISAL